MAEFLDFFMVGALLSFASHLITFTFGLPFRTARAIKKLL